MSATRKSERRAVEASRRERVAQMRAAHEQADRRKRLRRISVIITGAIILAAAIAVPLSLRSKNSKSQSINGVVTYTGLAQTHTDSSVTYPQIPPVGGPHNAQWLNCGVYTTPVPTENAVHDLEHGAVWITYQPSLPADQIAALRALEQRQTVVRGSRFVTVSPDPNLPSPVIASAWGAQLKLTTASDPRLAEFIAQYRIGRHAPEPGAACTGGVGTPAAR
jgi:hypothetical protein